MWYRLYFRTPDGRTGVEEVESKQLNGLGELVRLCDNHGRVLYGEPWPETPKAINCTTTQPRYHA